jgi:hypothetical protein
VLLKCSDAQAGVASVAVSKRYTQRPRFKRYRNIPLRSCPICAYPRLELAPGSDLKVKPHSLPEKLPSANAGANEPRKAARSVGGTLVPLPRATNGPVARHEMEKLTEAGTCVGPKNWNESTTGRSETRSVALCPSWSMWRPPEGTSKIQKSPVCWMPPLLSWRC